MDLVRQRIERQYLLEAFKEMENSFLSQVVIKKPTIATMERDRYLTQGVKIDFADKLQPQTNLLKKTVEELKNLEQAVNASQPTNAPFNPLSLFNLPNPPIPQTNASLGTALGTVLEDCALGDGPLCQPRCRGHLAVGGTH